jgi:hypothetical protein
MVSALRAAVRTLQKDGSLAEPVKVQPKKLPYEEQKVLPKIPLPAVAVALPPPPPAAPAAPVPKPPAAAVVNPVAPSATAMSFPPPAANEPVPIAFGLDKFLQDPRKFDIEVSPVNLPQSTVTDLSPSFPPSLAGTVCSSRRHHPMSGANSIGDFRGCIAGCSIASVAARGIFLVRPGARGVGGHGSAGAVRAGVEANAGHLAQASRRTWYTHILFLFF